MELCKDCLIKYLKRKKEMILFMKNRHKTNNKFKKPGKMIYCKKCDAYIKMEQSLYKFRSFPSWNASDGNNCIVGCGYGMFAPKFYKEHVIDTRRK